MNRFLLSVLLFLVLQGGGLWAQDASRPATTDHPGSVRGHVADKGDELAARREQLYGLFPGLLAGLVSGPRGGGEVTDLVVGLGESRSGTLRHQLARALGDPSLEVRDMVLETGMEKGAALSYDRLDDVAQELARIER